MKAKCRLQKRATKLTPERVDAQKSKVTSVIQYESLLNAFDDMLSFL